MQVTAFAEHQGTRKDAIDATIFVEQESQKGIVIGRGGSALKSLGTAARADIEQFLGAPACKHIPLMQVLLPHFWLQMVDGRCSSVVRPAVQLRKALCAAGRPVYLSLTVKVKQKWRKSEEALNELGY